MLVHSKNGSFSVPSDYDGAIIRMIKRSKNASYMLLQSRTIAGRKCGKFSWIMEAEEHEASVKSYYNFAEPNVPR